MTLNLCNAFKEIENFMPDSLSSESKDANRNLYKVYCPTDRTGKQECQTDGQRIEAMFKYLLQALFVNNEEDLESENQNNEYSEYALLWLSNKIKKFKYQNNMHVLDFYFTFIKNDNWYNNFRNKINEKNKIMKIEIGQMYNLYELFTILCNAITNYNDDPSNCSECSKFANKWNERSKGLVNKKTKVFEDEQYCDMLRILKNAYENFRKGTNNQNGLPELEEIEGMKNCKELCKGATRSRKIIRVPIQEVEKHPKINGDESDKQSSEEKTKESNPVETPGPAAILSNTGDTSQNDAIEIGTDESRENLDTILSKKYGLIGIGGVALLIPIISTVLYKYWFARWRNKSERKKNVKKVTNLAVGTNPPKEL
ncbi:CIR protein [Plasmodium chabaudi chabaudi]|uniref:CIR protein n=1 Tax=Plasmodium chabaudi chabaudi TaxID=31271 RepID=A0A1C6W9M8_PLACU|nr:CIR protein [Plasmodium chabaudi chabaudi]